jgi:hypothetical protein
MKCVIKCVYCDSAAKIKHNHVYMVCICDDECRILDLDKIKMGLYPNTVYLLNDSSSIVHPYEKTKQGESNICDV